MAAATRTRPKRTRARVGFRSSAELFEVLDRVLTEVNSDERSGPSLRSTGLALRIECPDLDACVEVWASDDPATFLEWRFERDGEWKPKLSLRMGSDVLNEWLQGRISVPMAIAHRQMSCSGDARCALLYLPAVKLIGGPYERLVAREYPHLAA